MFSLFGRKKGVAITDCVWMTEAARDTALYTWLKEPKRYAIGWFRQEVARLKIRFPDLEDRMLLADQLGYHRLAESEVIFSGHYPLHAEELMLAESQGFSAMTFYTSLDSGLMKLFGSEKISGMMRNMGMKEDEMISHSMVTAAITNAQKKLAEKVTTELKASSEEEWFRLNTGLGN